MTNLEVINELTQLQKQFSSQPYTQFVVIEGCVDNVLAEFVADRFLIPLLEFPLGWLEPEVKVKPASQNREFLTIERCVQIGSNWAFPTSVRFGDFEADRVNTMPQGVKNRYVDFPL